MLDIFTADFADNADFFCCSGGLRPSQINATLTERRYSKSPAHDVDGENAALMTCKQVVNEVADD